MGEPRGGRPQAVGDAADGVDDPRVRAVLEVLAGEPTEVVAARWSVEAVLLARWTRAFVEAGSAQVTNRPVGDIARHRDRFLTTFMHGLRGPLAVAQMWVGLLEDASGAGAGAGAGTGAAGGGVGVGDIAGHLQAALDQLDEQATDVELLTAAMLGRLVLEARRVAVAELVEVVAPGALVGGEGGAVEVHVDPTLFTRILRDLWSAAGTTGTAGTVGVVAGSLRLEVETVHPWVELRVVREGAPIEPAVLHALFEPFDRADDHEQVTVGLYLARALVVVHGGTVGVEQDEHRTVFGVRIPDARLVPVPS